MRRGSASVIASSAGLRPHLGRSGGASSNIVHLESIRTAQSWPRPGPSRGEHTRDGLIASTLFNAERIKGSGRWADRASDMRRAESLGLTATWVLLRDNAQRHKDSGCEI